MGLSRIRLQAGKDFDENLQAVQLHVEDVCTYVFSPILVFTACWQVWKGLDHFTDFILETLKNWLIANDILLAGKQGKSYLL